MSLPTPTHLSPRAHYVLVNPEQDGQRLDNLLLATLKGAPRALVYRLLRTGQVRVNQGRAKPDYRVGAGDRIRIPPLRLPEPPVPGMPPVALLRQLDSALLYEDERLLVVNKPAGLAVHGGSGIGFGIIEIVRALRPEATSLELVHRLDRDTSGCLLLTKRRATLRWLHQLMRDGQMTKRYLALLAGPCSHATLEVNAPLRKNTLQNGERLVRVDATGKPSQTQFRRLRQFTNATLVEALPRTGRTHQIRVHAAHVGMPLLGDEKYGKRAANQVGRALGLRRLFLHAAAISFPWPDGAGQFQISAPLAEDLAIVLDALGVL